MNVAFVQCFGKVKERKFIYSQLDLRLEACGVVQSIQIKFLKFQLAGRLNTSWLFTKRDRGFEEGATP